jgi:hypothetical protein
MAGISALIVGGHFYYTSYNHIPYHFFFVKPYEFPEFRPGIGYISGITFKLQYARNSLQMITLCQI